ncbi:MAG TPA: O-antigen ligase family protein [Rudaea sp.]|nr:O-antigen ligase family protein [Rudaea sp.]
MNSPLPDRPASAPAYAARVRLAEPALPAKPRHNWFLYAFLVLLPLQNLQTGYMPNLGGGLNFLNVGFGLAMLGALACRGGIAARAPVHGWILAYATYAVFSLFVGFANVSSETEEHFNILKDALLAVMLIFVVEMSVTDWTTLKRTMAAMLLPLPYMLRVTWDQHASVNRWHYSDALRISGTFSLLGANEYAAFCVTMAVVAFALLLAGKLPRRWRVALAAAVGMMGICVMWSYSRTAYIALLLGLLSVVLLWRARWKMILPLFLAALVLPNFMPASVVERFDSTTIEEGKRDESTEMRFEFWQIAWDNFTQHPVFGSGFHTFHHHEINPFNMDTHNFFMRELTEKGIVGFCITLGMLLSILRVCWRTMATSPPDSLAYALGLGMVGAWLALVVGNFFGDRFTYYPVIGYFWTWLGLTLKAREFAGTARETATETPRAVPPLREYARPRSYADG